MNSLLNFIKINASKKNIFIGILLIILFNTVFLPYFPKLFKDDPIDIKYALDIKFTYSPETSYNILSEMGGKARYIYRLSEIFVDIPYAIIYGFIYAFIIYSLININKLQHLSYLVITPLLISFFDLLENTGIITMLTKFPQKLETISNLTSFFTSLKWIFAAITLIIIFTLLIRYFYKKQALNL